MLFRWRVTAYCWVPYETKVHSVGRMRSYNMLQIGGTCRTTGVWRVNVLLAGALLRKLNENGFCKIGRYVYLISVDKLLWNVPFIVNLFSAHVAIRDHPREMLQFRLYVLLKRSLLLCVRSHVFWEIAFILPYFVISYQHFQNCVRTRPILLMKRMMGFTINLLRDVERSLKGW
jgi:hypothetical protein